MIKLSIAIRKVEEIEKDCKRIEDYFTDVEQKESKITLAGRLAAKDAFLKNIGITQRDRLYKKVKIDRMPSGRPLLKILDSNLSQKLSGCKISISISHTKQEAVAVCVVYK
ncbi:MAG: hypothetical protein NC832_02015 [Candidatus Omnitrophica bacterium]|nr:hypothetical protein [Candidatus Omnitrophota bacterium]